MSTNKTIDFYVLTATDTEITGIQLVLAGYMHDLRRVRFWDISREEYKKRIANDLRINRGVIWKKPVISLFKDMEKLSTGELLQKYFVSDRSAEEISPLFYSELLELAFKENIRNEVLEIKSTSLKQGEVVVYAKVRSTFKPSFEYVEYDFLIPSGYEAEYMFILTYDSGAYKIDRVIPFHYLNEKERMERVEFPEELGLYRSIDTWLEDFSVEEIRLPDFLAQQLTRRVNQLLQEDAEIAEQFDHVRVEFAHVEGGNGADDTAGTPSQMVNDAKDFSAMRRGVGNHFRLMVLTNPREGSNAPLFAGDGKLVSEDVRHVLDMTLREFVNVIKSYRFDDFEYLDIVSPPESDIIVLGKEALERYRQKRLPLLDLFKASYPSL